MYDELVFFDVETPNGRNDRICSLGLVVSDSAGNVLDRQSFLINPEESFSDFNMRITGITPHLVKAAPTFDELWRNDIGDLFSDHLLVAHNASFDLTVLAKTLEHYRLGGMVFSYACTCRMAKMLHPEYPNYKLPTVCSNLDIPLGNHHDALCDAEACNNIFWSFIGDVPDYKQVFSIFNTDEHLCHSNREGTHPRSYSQATLSTRSLFELFNSAIEDGSISFDEASCILEFIQAHKELDNDDSINEIQKVITRIISDGDIDPSESDCLLEYFSLYVSPTERFGERELSFSGKTFCLSGVFEHGPKEEIEQYILSRGGTCIKSVTKKCNYVVVGGCGSEAWSMGNYGTKVKKALDWKAKGVEIEIVPENSLFDQ